MKELQSFLGFVGFYRRFIKDFALLAQPLHKLTKNRTVGKKTVRISKPEPFIWGVDQQNAFDELKRRCTSCPVLALADFTKPFSVNVDASAVSLRQCYIKSVMV